MKLRLHVSVALAFALLLVIVLGVSTGTLFFNNRALAIKTAKVAMANARADSDLALIGVINPVLRVTVATAELIEAFPDRALDRRALNVVDALMSGLDQISGAYVGFAQDGAFLQVARLAPGDAAFGDSRTPVPPGATRVLRIITGTENRRRERLVFLSEDGRDLLTTVGAAAFDPTLRPWFAAAVGSDTPVFSPIYTFAGTGRPGVTLSRRILAADGRVVGVVGADMSIEAMTATMARIRVDGVGEIFLVGPDGQLMTSSEHEGGAADTPLTDAAMQAAQGAESALVRFAMPGTGERHLVSIAPASQMLNSRPLLGVIVPERHFTGAIIETTLFVLQISAVIAVLAVLCTVWLAGLLSKPLALVAAEARRISAFDLSGDFKMSSRISEVANVGAAIANMRNSLISFGAFVPREVVRAIVADGGHVAVGGAERVVTLMFSDIEGFTTKSEPLSPEIVMRDLSQYFQTMEEAVSRHGGTVDKYIGDAVMALWNAPAEEPAHAERACRAALACRAAERALGSGPGGVSLFPTRTRIGLHCDRVIVGNVGSANRLQYTALGGAVNLASRIEGLNKAYGTDILATQAVVDRVGDRFLFRPVDHVSPAGTTRPVALFELIGEQAPDAECPVTDAQRADVAAWDAALTLYRAQDWQAAHAAFAALRDAGSPARLTRLYLDRIARFQADPPPPDWDGVQVFQDK